MSVALQRTAILLGLLIVTLPPAVRGALDEAVLADLRSRDAITIAITDSGLGGLSVVADAEAKLRQWGVYAEVDLVFYNALFSDEGGYNSLPGREDKVGIFSRALEDLQERYAPDVILIACNTLSVLYRDTEFAAATRTPVVGIVEGGVDLIAQHLPAATPGTTIIFATETTVAEDSHREALVARGIAPERIVVQACPQLADYVEQGFDSMETAFLIDAYVGDALAAAGDVDGPLCVSFNCTHYGYSLAAWQEAFAARGVPVEAFLDPNTTMIDVLRDPAHRGRHADPSIRVQVVSMVEIPPARRESIGRYLQAISPATAAALDRYLLVPDLFAWRDLVGAGASH